MVSYIYVVADAINIRYVSYSNSLVLHNHAGVTQSCWCYTIKLYSIMYYIHNMSG